MIQYEYKLEVKRVLATEISNSEGTQKIMLEFFNELGAEGKRVTFFQEGQEPGTIAALNGQAVPYYVLTALTEKQIGDGGPTGGTPVAVASEEVAYTEQGATRLKAVA